MPWWMKWRLYKLSEEVSGGLFSGIWFLLKWTIFLMPTLIIKMTKHIYIPMMSKIFLFMLQLVLFMFCLPFVLLYAIISAIFSKEN
jgi:hypothetical protein